VDKQPETTREKAMQLIASMEQHILDLEKLQGHAEEIEACKAAIERLKDLLQPAN
jgi:hypothetical protein